MQGSLNICVPHSNSFTLRTGAMGFECDLCQIEQLREALAFYANDDWSFSAEFERVDVRFTTLKLKEVLTDGGDRAREALGLPKIEKFYNKFGKHKMESR